WVGMYGGRPLIEKYGKYVLISRHDLDLADRWFARYGEVIVFASRLLPVVRTFIAFPAGVARMRVPRFILYTFLGSLPWCLGVAQPGRALGSGPRGRKFKSFRPDCNCENKRAGQSSPLFCCQHLSFKSAASFRRLLACVFEHCSDVHPFAVAFDVDAWLRGRIAFGKRGVSGEQGTDGGAVAGGHTPAPIFAHEILARDDLAFALERRTSVPINHRIRHRQITRHMHCA